MPQVAVGSARVVSPVSGVPSGDHRSYWDTSTRLTAVVSRRRTPRREVGAVPGPCAYMSAARYAANAGSRGGHSGQLGRSTGSEDVTSDRRREDDSSLGSPNTAGLTNPDR